MSFPRIPLIVTAPLLAVFLLTAASELQALPAVHAQNNAQETQPEKTAEFVYVCPMHEDVTSKKPGKCRKCKMKLEKKKVKDAKPADQ